MPSGETPRSRSSWRSSRPHRQRARTHPLLRCSELRRKRSRRTSSPRGRQARCPRHPGARPCCLPLLSRLPPSRPAWTHRGRRRSAILRSGNALLRPLAPGACLHAPVRGRRLRTGLHDGGGHCRGHPRRGRPGSAAQDDRHPHGQCQQVRRAWWRRAHHRLRSSWRCSTHRHQQHRSDDSRGGELSDLRPLLPKRPGPHLRHRALSGT